MINKSLENSIKEIINKTIKIDRIFKANNRIEIVTKNPTTYTSIIYKNNQDRDLDYIELDNNIYHLVKL